MTIHILERPDSMPELADWLERHLVNDTLGEVVAELRAVADHSDNPPLSNLVDVESVLKSGLRRIPEDNVRLLFRHPNRLLELQERILIDGGDYWDQVPRSQALIESSQRAYGRLQESTHDRFSPARVLMTANPPATRWILSLAALFLVGLALGWMAPHGNAQSGIAWTRSEAFRPPVNRQEFLRRLATLAKEWFDEKPTSPEMLASRIIEFRKGCALLQLHADVIPADDRKWLLQDCRKWSDRLDEQLQNVEDLAAAKSGPSIEEIRTGTDAIIQSLITKLETKAKA